MSEPLPETSQDNLQKVCYIVGPKTPTRDKVENFLHEECNLQPISKEIAATRTPGGAPFSEDILDTIFKRPQIVIFPLTGEEQVYLRKDFDQDYDKALWQQPTQDQLFEAGYAFGRYHEHVFLVRSGKVQPLSDIAGRFIYDFDNLGHRDALKSLLQQRAGQLARKKGRFSPSSQSDGAEAEPSDEEMRKRKKVFVVFGRNTFILDEVRAFLRVIGLSPILWGQALAHTGTVAGATGEVLEAAFSQAWAVVVLLTGDDLILPAGGGVEENNLGHQAPLAPQPRANVLFEAGMAFGNRRLEDKTILVEFEFDGKLKLGSHVAYHQRLRLSNSTDRREEFIRRLRTAGCIVDLKSRKWHSTGNFYFAYKA